MPMRRPKPDSAVAERFASLGVVGHSPAMLRTIQLASEVAPYDLPVLITGPTGSGKTVLARVIHEMSGRRGHFVEVNASTLQPELGRSEVFGIGKAVATNVANRSGLLHRANFGTLFFDEVATLDRDIQASLLTAVETGRFNRIGVVEPETVDVRWIFATNENLGHAISGGRFRHDLHSRMAVWTIEMPSLNERLDDIEELSELLLRRATQRLHRPYVGLSRAALEALQQVDWSQGNIRQLDNVLQRGLVRALNHGRGRIVVDDILEQPLENSVLGYQVAKARWHRAWLIHRLHQFDWDVRRTAAAINVSLSQTYKWMTDYGIQRQ